MADKMSPPNVAPPPPPPPLPPMDGGQSPPTMTNGSIPMIDQQVNGTPNGILPNQQQQQTRQISPPVKKPITPYQDDTRSDLMKAIRNGE